MDAYTAFVLDLPVAAPAPATARDVILARWYAEWRAEREAASPDTEEVLADLNRRLDRMARRKRECEEDERALQAEQAAQEQAEARPQCARVLKGPSSPARGGGSAQR